MVLSFIKRFDRYYSLLLLLSLGQHVPHEVGVYQTLDLGSVSRLDLRGEPAVLRVYQGYYDLLTLRMIFSEEKQTRVCASLFPEPIS